ncbi:LutC/YkgG family protein [Aliamphritea ceti]|uniref:LutC/YkgG family protein n=1 Tax=Aliamphritea ceti TaxID=1524258 RepID=UPI0021C465DC|nr:LUD domain-containing protein [Aliamphritea ceti]
MSRAEIFANIHRGLGREIPTDEQRQTVQNRLKAKADNIIPARAQLPQPQQIELFKSMATEAAAELIELDTLEQLPAACDDWLKTQNLNEFICASDPQLEALDWTVISAARQQRVAQVGDMAALTTSFAGIAETGTLMLYSRPESPTTLNFLPDNHLVVLHEKDILGVYEEAWKKLRNHCQTDDGLLKLPRTVNMITGPSRSADIEQTLLMGAHGPKQLVIFIIKG